MNIEIYEIEIIYGSPEPITKSNEFSIGITDIKLSQKTIDTKYFKIEPQAVNNRFIYSAETLKEAYSIIVRYLKGDLSLSMEKLKKTILKEYPELWI